MALVVNGARCDIESHWDAQSSGQLGWAQRAPIAVGAGAPAGAPRMRSAAYTASRGCTKRTPN